MKKISAVCLITVLLVAQAFAFNTAGPNLPTAATGTTNTIGGGTHSWTTPTAIETGSGNAVVNFGAATGVSADLIGSGFGFAITSTDTINGILLQINGGESVGVGLQIEKNVRLLKAGTAAGIDEASGTTLPSALTVISHGGSSDLWGTTWTPADINNTGFGAAWVTQAVTTTTSSSAANTFKITVTSTSAPPPGSQFLQMFGFKFDPPKPHSQTRFIAARVSGPNTRRETQP
jgi:hypothetical protein